MDKLTKKEAKAEKTLLSALLLSSPGPFITGFSALKSRNLTQFADFLRRTTELLAVFISYWVYRKLKKEEVTLLDQEKLENLSRKAVKKAMIFSGVVLFFLGFYQFFNYRPGGDVRIGLVIAILGFLVNGYFWLKYRSMSEDSFATVVKAQAILYRAKTAIDFIVVLALAAVWLAPLHNLTKLVDLGGSLFISVYLIYQGYKT
ncbi:MAG: cation transporter [Firmicutes bacterium]|nr:cation transporter [Bacillota bacterium]